MLNFKTSFNTLHIGCSFAAVLSTFVQLDRVTDILFKIASLLLILVFYLIKKAKNIKPLYLIIVGLLIYSNALFSFGDRYLKQIVVINMFEKTALLFLILNTLKKKDYKNILKFSILIIFSTAPLYYFFNKTIPDYNFIIFICYVLTCVLIALSYIDFVVINNKRLFFCFLAILLLCFAEVFFGIFFYFDNSQLYLSSGFFILSFARYFFYLFMIEAGGRRYF